jgi:hypothetical protein
MFLLFFGGQTPATTLTLTLSLFNQSKNHLPPDLAAHVHLVARGSCRFFAWL